VAAVRPCVFEALCKRFAAEDARSLRQKDSWLPVRSTLWRQLQDTQCSPTHGSAGRLTAFLDAHYGDSEWRAMVLTSPTWRLYFALRGLRLARCLSSAHHHEQSRPCFQSRHLVCNAGSGQGPTFCTCFVLLENALLTRIADLLHAKDLVRFAASCTRFAGLEKESSKLKHAQLCAHFTAAGEAETVAWLTSNILAHALAARYHI
jgi:hypothetical protein